MSVKLQIEKLLKTAAEDVYLDRILKLSTPEQLDMYNRMYPNGASQDQRHRATQQVEATILGLNKYVQSLKNIEKEFEIHKQKCEADAISFEKQINMLNAELSAANYQIKLLSTPENINSSVIQSRLDKLDALESAGVDNWEGYDYAMEELNK